MTEEICTNCGQAVPLDNMVIDLRGDTREVFHFECFITGAGVTEDDCF